MGIIDWKDEVVDSVSWWGKETSGIEDVFGHFRDILTLRYELMTKAEKAFEELDSAHKRHHTTIRVRIIRR